MMDYNEENLKIVTKTILKHLTPDLLPKKWIERNSTNPMFGHCHNSSACLQKIFGSKNIKLWRGLDDEDIWHWWAVDLNDKLIDITADQYTSQDRTPPYDKGAKSSMLGFEYRIRVLTLLGRVTEELSSNGTPPM